MTPEPAQPNPLPPGKHTRVGVGGGKETGVRNERRRQMSNRRRSIEGCTRGTQRMIEDDQDQCGPATIKHILFVQGADYGASALISEKHLHTPANTAIRPDDVVKRDRIRGKRLKLFRSGSRVSWNRSLPRSELGVLGDGCGSEPREEVS